MKLGGFDEVEKIDYYPMGDSVQVPVCAEAADGYSGLDETAIRAADGLVMSPVTLTDHIDPIPRLNVF